MVLSQSDAAFLDQAILSFERETGLAVSLDSKQSRPDVDACLRLNPFGIKYHVELKRWAQHANIGSLMAQLSKVAEPALLVADYINPNMANRLREADIQFIDVSGNAYLRAENLYIFIKGNRLASGISAPKKTTRAFNTSGLKLIFSFLMAPDLVGETYRNIAAATNVSLGTIGWVLNDLKERGYVQDGRKGRPRELKSPLDLLDRWVEAYPERLLPELDLGLFRTQSQFPWKDIQPSEFGGCWGGEVGASLLDHYLSPAQGLIYLPKSRLKELAVKHRLRKGDENESERSDTVRVCEKFWLRGPAASHQDHREAAPDILIYADLLASGDPRNLEAAERLYGRIKNRLQID